MIELESHHLESPLEKLSQARIINGYFLNYKMKNCCNKLHKNHFTDYLLVTIGKWYFQNGRMVPITFRKLSKFNLHSIGPVDTVCTSWCYVSEKYAAHRLISVLAKVLTWIQSQGNDQNNMEYGTFYKTGLDSSKMKYHERSGK